jgi:hypothetical protein
LAAGLTSRQTGRLTVGRNITLTLTFDFDVCECCRWMLKYVCRLYSNHYTNIILDIKCCTTLLTLAIQSVRVHLEVTLEPILEVEVTLRYES